MNSKVLLSLMLSLTLTLSVQHQAQATKHVITQSGFTFNPSNLMNVNIGDTIRWVWTSGFHTTTSSSIPVGAASWDAILSSSSPSFEYRVTTSGIYNYVCTFHITLGMVGSFTVNAPPALSISGNVFDDANGLQGAPANTVDGSPTNAGGNVFANLVSSGNLVLASVAVSAGGTYSFNNASGVAPNTSYSIILTKSMSSPGSSLTSATYASNWVSTGEHLGTGAGNDGNPDGVLSVTVASTSVTNANFGLDQLPSPMALSPLPMLNPGGIVMVTLEAADFSGMDPESPAGFITQVRIASFPSNSNSISINGTSYTQATWPGAGVLIPTNAAGNPTQAISVDPVDGGITVSVTFTVIDNAGFESAGSGNVNLVFTNPFNTISGTLSYNDNASVGLPNSTVDLKDLTTNQIVKSASTNSSGAFTFTGVPDGNYTLIASTTVLWGGVNATDALNVLKHFVGITYLSGLRFIAANVDNNSIINSLDALVVARRFVGLITSFPVGDWHFESPSISVSGSNTYTVNFQGICYGDADGSYSSFNLKMAPSVTVVHNTIRSIRPGQEVTIPVTLTQESETLGAVSLVLSLPENLATVEKVTMAGNTGSLLFNQMNDKLAISWFGLDPVTVTEGNPVLLITLKTSEDLKDGSTLEFSPDGSPELADAQARPINNVTIDIPTLVSSTGASIKHIITQMGITFVPDNLTGVLPGDTVQWVWTAGSHTVTSGVIPSGAASWDQMLNSANPKVNYVPELAGEYNYYCIPHQSLGMIGKFTVSSPTGIDNPVSAGNIFTITPNPVTENTAVLSLSSDKDLVVTVKLYDILGAEIKASLMDISPGMNTQTLDLTGLKDGIYFVRVWNDNNSLQTRKLIKR